MPRSKIPHEDSPDLTPLAADEADPIAAVIAQADGEVKDEQEQEQEQAGGGGGEEDEEMDEMGSEDEGEDYEAERQRIIKENANLMAQLGLANGAAIPRSNRLHTNGTGTGNGTAAALHKAGRGQPDKKPVLSSEEQRIRREAKAQAAALKRQVGPTRRSGRVAAMGQKRDYTGDGTHADSPSPAPSSPQRYRPDPIPKAQAPIIPSGPEYDLAADDEGEYEERAPPPGREDDGTLVFEGRWRGVFTPNVTPEEMFKGGAFGGAFFCDTYSQPLRAPLPSAPDIASLPFPFPQSMIKTHLTRPEPNGLVNRFKQRAGQSLQAWEKAGWIWGVDPRGWAQWYVRFWAGRRSVDDERQIRRWIKVAGPTGRFKRSLLSTIQQRGGKAVLENEDVGRVVRQTLWQWGYELTESEYDRAMGV